MTCHESFRPLELCWIESRQLDRLRTYHIHTDWAILAIVALEAGLAESAGLSILESTKIEGIARQPDVNTLRRIGGWLTPYRGRMMLALALTTLACLFNLPVPLLVQDLVDRVVTQNRWNALPLYAFALFGVFAMQSVLTFFNSVVIGQVGQGVVRDLRHTLYERLQQLDLAYYDKTSSGAIIARVMDDVGAIQVFVTGQTFTILTDLGTTVAIAALLLVRDWRLALVVLAVAPLFVANFRYFMWRIRATNTVIREIRWTYFLGISKPSWMARW